MSENGQKSTNVVEQDKDSAEKSSALSKQQSAPQQSDQPPLQQQHQKQKSPLLTRNRTASAPISSTNPNVTSHPLHATNLSLSSPSSSCKSSPKSSFRAHFQAATTTTTPSSPSSTALRSATTVASASGPTASGPAPVPPLVGSVPKTPPRRRSKLNTHRKVLDMHLHIPIQDLSSVNDKHNPLDAPFSPGLTG